MRIVYHAKVTNVTELGFEKSALSNLLRDGVIKREDHDLVFLAMRLVEKKMPEKERGRSYARDGDFISLQFESAYSDSKSSMGEIVGMNATLNGKEGRGYATLLYKMTEVEAAMEVGAMCSAAKGDM